MAFYLLFLRVLLPPTLSKRFLTRIVRKKRAVEGYAAFWLAACGRGFSSADSAQHRRQFVKALMGG
jgi:hypothetical protein